MVRRVRPAAKPVGPLRLDVVTQPVSLTLPAAVTRPAAATRPVRTCVGCRKRAPASELLRLVAIETDVEHFVVVPDPARRRPGRGAHVHPVPACLELAERRRAFGRALRITGVIDTGPLAEAVRAATQPPGTADGGRIKPRPDKAR